MLCVDEEDVATTVDIDKRYFQMRLGIYASGWFDPMDPKPNTSHWYSSVVCFGFVVNGLISIFFRIFYLICTLKNSTNF